MSLHEIKVQSLKFFFRQAPSSNNFSAGGRIPVFCGKIFGPFSSAHLFVTRISYSTQAVKIEEHNLYTHLCLKKQLKNIFFRKIKIIKVTKSFQRIGFGLFLSE